MQFIYLFDPYVVGAMHHQKALPHLPKRTPLMSMPQGFLLMEKMIDAHFTNHAWTNDTRISQITGLPFSEDYRQLLLKGGAFNSFALTVACALLKRHKPNELLSVFSQLQKCDMWAVWIRAILMWLKMA